MTTVKQKTAFILLVAALVLSAAMPVTYAAFWNRFSSASTVEQIGGIEIGDYDHNYDGGQLPLDRLPDYVPDAIMDRLEELRDGGASDDQLNALIDALITLIDHPHYSNDIKLGLDSSDLFYDGALQQGDFLLYTSIDDNGDVYAELVYITRHGEITSEQQLLDHLSRPFDGVNSVSSIWQHSNLYTTFHAPVEYDGRLYLMYHNGPAGSSPASQRGTWFEVTPDYEYSSQNNYFPGYLVRYQGEYYHGFNAWSPPPTTTWGWEKLNTWQSGTYHSGTIVVVHAPSGVQFWRATATTSAEPNTETTPMRAWQQIANGWIGNTGRIVYHYFEHNSYSRDEMVIHGVSPRLRYVYYRAIQNVPAGEPPRIQVNGQWQLNSTYWVEVSQ